MAQIVGNVGVDAGRSRCPTADPVRDDAAQHKLRGRWALAHVASAGITLLI